MGGGSTGGYPGLWTLNVNNSATNTNSNNGSRLASGKSARSGIAQGRADRAQPLGVTLLAVTAKRQTTGAAIGGPGFLILYG
tara:strand:- start:1241 stop:1486 length:246 start_codon:yes stop_codon:yes gene_type:complete